MVKTALDFIYLFLPFPYVHLIFGIFSSAWGGWWGDPDSFPWLAAHSESWTFSLSDCTMWQHHLTWNWWCFILLLLVILQIRRWQYDKIANILNAKEFKNYIINMLNGSTFSFNKSNCSAIVFLIYSKVRVRFNCAETRSRERPSRPAVFTSTLCYPEGRHTGISMHVMQPHKTDCCTQVFCA